MIMNRRDFITSSSIVVVGISTGLLSREVASASYPARKDILLNVKRNGRLISLDLPLSGKVSTVEVRLFSNANNYIFEYDDVSPYAPKADNEQTREVWIPEYEARAEARRQSSREQRFPVVDLVLKKGMEAVIEINLKEQGENNFNGYGTNPITKEIRIPEEQVEHWGNTLILDPKTNSIQKISAQI